MNSPLLEKPLDFPQPFGIMCITTRKARGNDRLKTVLPSEINITQMQDIFSQQSPENRGREIRL